MEKILRTLDSLKMPSSMESLSSSVTAASDSVKTQKKERISHCMTVTDAVCSSNIQNLAEYSKILENVTEVLFQLCNDPDSDIRLVATDCLHRIVRTVRDQYQHRFQMEIYKEIKKNQSPRSLKIALNLFAFMSPLIRPQKCRVFMLSLLPCFAQISKRTEEALYENLAPAFCEIFKNLGPFVNDNEVKILCKDFMTNLESSSAIIRRSSASILTYICQYSRKPHVFLPKLLNQVTELLLPNLMEKSVATIIGVLSCVRQCIQPIYAQLRQNFEKKSPDQDCVVKNLIQIYECCMLLCNHDDHNVITTSLDTLQQLLNNPVEHVIQKLCSPVGIQNSLDAGKWEPKIETGPLSSSMCSLDYTDATNLLEGDSDVPNFRSLISSNASEAKEDFDMDISFSSSRRNSEVFALEDTRDNEFGSSLEVLQQSDDDQSKKLYGFQNFPEIHIGSLYDSNIPVYYCARFLAYNFLLAGQKGHQRPDSEVRISVKVLATNCLINLIKIRPEIFSLRLSVKENTEENSELENRQQDQTLVDLLLLLKHSDPLLRGSIYILIGNVLKCTQEAGLEHTFSILSIQIVDLINALNDGLKDSSNIGVKCAISAVGTCLTPLLRTRSELPAVSNMLQILLVTALNSYWLVKVDLVDVLAGIEWDNIPEKQKKQQEVMHVLLDLLSDEDARVRSGTTNALIKYIKFASACEFWNQETILCEKCVINQINKNLLIDCACTTITSTSICKLESVIMSMLKRLGDQDEKYAIAGFYLALGNLSESFPPKKFKSVWRCEKSPEKTMCSLFLVALDSLRSSPIVYDISIHQSILSLTCNLFAGLLCNVDPESSSCTSTNNEKNLFFDSDSTLSNHGVMLIHHCLAVLKLYQSLIESTPFHSRKVSSSPVLSPVKKFSQKLENEKKALVSESEPEKKNKGLVLTTSTTCSQHFKKIAESLAQNWKIYKSNLDPAITTKFTGLLIAALRGLGQLFEFIRSDFVGLASLIDEILAVTSTLFHICPIPTLKCVQNMLNCLFTPFKSEAIGRKSLESATVSLFENIKDPIEKFMTFADVYHKALLLNRRSVVVKTPTEKSALGSYIRQFEPIVVTALRMYTTSSDVEIQSEVLRLLSKLIKGHVNYGLVDKSQVFLGFVIKQIGFLEEGHIRTDGEIVDTLFEFLTLLSHEQHHFDIPKILRLCDGLGCSSGQNPVTHCIPALKRVVHDLFIQRSQSTSTHIEKKELETQREVLFQMLMKLCSIPQTLLVLWVVIEGRRESNQLKWQEDSVTVVANLLPLIENSELQITSKLDFCNLMALLFSVSPNSIPPVENIVATLNEALKFCKHTNAMDFMQWQLLVTSHFLILVKQITAQEGPITENECTARFILELLKTYVEKLLYIVQTSFVEIETNRQFMIELTIVFLQCTTNYVRKGKYPNVISELHSEDNIKSWISIVESFMKLSVLNPVIINNLVELLATLLYSNVAVWLSLIQNLSECTKYFLPQILIRLMEALNDAEVPTLEEWITASHTSSILMNLDNTTVSKFISRSSKFRIQTMLDEITVILNSELNIELLFAKNILKFLERVYTTFVAETAILSIKLLKSQTEPFLLLEIVQFSSFVFGMCKCEEIQFSSSDNLILIEFIKDAEAKIKYPRLVTLVEHFVNSQKEEDYKDSDVIDAVKTIEPTSVGYPIGNWCCAEVNKVEGIALTKLLSHLTYSQLMKIFNQPNFNLTLLSYCFSHLQTLFLKGSMDTEDVVDLFSEKRSCLIDKCPLGVAAFDFIVTILDKWENSISENILHSWNDDEADEIIENVEFTNQLPDMWRSLETILNLKESVIKSGCIERKSCRYNFVATKFFTFSFQYMKVKSAKSKKLTTPIENLEGFLSFATTVVNDSSFMKFFDVRDEPDSIFTCTKCLGSILRHIVRVYNINFTVDMSVSEAWWTEMNETCAQVLTEFNYMSDFVQNVEQGKISLKNSLFKSLRSVVAGIGRCDIINMYILTSHLGWRPVSIISNEVFPPVKQIPIDILQNEKELLLQYIKKLNLFGAASKIQFEENWMTFLSVINSYGDEETSQLQIVCIGLRALSMIVEKTVKFVSVPVNPTEKSMKGLVNINLSLSSVEPDLCTSYNLVPLLSDRKKIVDNFYEIDANSCIRFLTDLYSQWLQNHQTKMPLLLLSEVVQSITRMAEYFEDISQFTWMFDTLMEIFKSFEKDDEILWPHLLYGIFYAAAKIPMEVEPMNNLAQILEGALSSPYTSTAAIQSSIVFLQHDPHSLQLLNVITPYVLKNTYLNELINNSETHSLAVWKLLLFIWIHGPSDNIGGFNFEQETLSNILTVLSPLNKVNVSVRLLVLKGLQKKIQMKTLSADSKRKIAKVTFDTLKTTNICIFFEAIKLFTVIYYIDFEEFYEVPGPCQEPEILMQMVERIEVLFQLLKHSTKYNSLIVSKVLPHIMMDFLPPSEILNRVIAEFLNPHQNNPELLAPVVAQLFEKARRRPKEAALVREWVVSSIPNFISNPDSSRIMWSLTLFFIGVSTTPEVYNLLAFAELRRPSLNNDLLIHAWMDFYSNLNSDQKLDFRNQLEKLEQSGKNPCSILLDNITKMEQPHLE